MRQGGDKDGGGDGSTANLLGLRLLPSSGGGDIIDVDDGSPPLDGPGTMAAAAAAAASTSGSSGGGIRKRRLHWSLAGLIIFSFSAPGALVGVPYAVGTAGFLGCLLVLGIFTAATCVGSLMLLEIYLANPRCQNLPELGLAAMGRRGRTLAATFQLMNFVGFLPVSLMINGLALQGTVGAGTDACVDGFILAISGLCFLTTQVRVLSNTQALALLSLTAIIAAGFIQLGIVFTHPNPAKEPAQLFGHPGPLTPTELARTFLGLTNCSWSFVPAFLLVELASAMPHPRAFTKGLALAAGLTATLFLAVGVTVVAAWGWGVPDPVYAIGHWPAHLPASRVMQGLILLANVVSYALDSVPLVRYCQRVWVPTFRDDWSLRSMATYALITLPTFLFGIVASVSVGNLLALLAFVSALSVPWVTQILPALFYHRWRARLAATSSTLDHWRLIDPATAGGDNGSHNNNNNNNNNNNDWPPLSSLAVSTSSASSSWLLPREGKYAPLSRKERVAVALVAVVGVANFLVCAWAAVGKVSIKELRGPTVIGCGRWTIFSDADQF